MGKCLKIVCRNQMLHRIWAKKENKFLVLYICGMDIERLFSFLLVPWLKGQRFDVDLENQSIGFRNFFILFSFFFRDFKWVIPSILTHK